MLSEMLRFKKYNRDKCISFAREYGADISGWKRFWMRLNLTRQIELPFIDLDVTTYCNLRCEKCAKLIPYYDKAQRENYDPVDVIGDLKKLLRYMDRIWVCSIIGGEPFLNPKLPEIIRFCSECEKIVRPNITTSGSVVPKKEVLEALRNSGVFVRISNYGKLGPAQMKNREEFVRQLEAYHIAYQFSPYNEWLDFGPVEPRHYPEEVRKKVLSECYINGCSVFNKGVLYRCGRASYMANHGRPMSEGQTIVAADIKNRRDLRKKVHRYYESVYMDACDYCTIHPAGIEPGIQMARPAADQSLPERTVEAI